MSCSCVHYIIFHQYLFIPQSVISLIYPFLANKIHLLPRNSGFHEIVIILRSGERRKLIEDKLTKLDGNRRWRAYNGDIPFLLDGLSGCIDGFESLAGLLLLDGSRDV